MIAMFIDGPTALLEAKLPMHRDEPEGCPALRPRWSDIVEMGAGYKVAEKGLSGIQKAAVRLGGALQPLAAILGKTAAGAAGTGALLGVGLASAADMAASLATTGSIAPRDGSIRGSAAGGIGGAIASVDQSLFRRFSSDAALESSSVASAGAVLSERQVERGEGRLDQALAATARDTQELIKRFQQEQEKTQRALQPALLEADRLSGDQALPAIGRAQRGLAQSERQVERMDVTDRHGNVDAIGQLAQAERLLELENQQLEQAQRRGQIEQETARTKVEAAREDLKTTEETVRRTEDKIRMLKESMMSAQERFADLDSKTQEKVLDIGRRAKAGEIVSTEERGLLRQFGGELGSDIAREQAVSLTQQTGFGDVFLQDQQKRMQELSARLEGPRGLQAKLDDQRGIVVQFEQDAEQIADRVTRVVLEQMEQRDSRLLELIDDRVKAEVERKNRESISRSQNTRRGLAGN